MSAGNGEGAKFFFFGAEMPRKFLSPEIKNYKAETDADLLPIPGQLELHGRCRLVCLVVCMLLCFVCCRSNCGDGGIRITLQTQRQI